MRRATWAVLACMGVGLAVPALADDPPTTGGDGTVQEAETMPDRAAGGQGSDGGSTVRVEEVRNGAGAMEPEDNATQEDRAERQFEEGVWTAP